MKWINHQIVTGFIVCTVTNDALFTASSIVGAVLPDRVEGSPPKESSAYWKWRKNHRTWSHYPPIYFALIVAAQFAKNYYPEPTLNFVLNLITYALVGALLHIAEDGICGKIPIFTPRKKYGIKLFKVGSWQEYFFAVLIILICLFIRFGDINLLINYFEMLRNYIP
ncbi:MAG: metal-dependent hydrolase [Selenomonadaceae bacterium]|nr:metal-dependent hydrolase [Selenomonadaceae bacterium]